MEFVSLSIIMGFVLIGLFQHLNKHWWNAYTKKYKYNNAGNVVFISKLTKSGAGTKEYFRDDGSLEKVEYFKFGKTTCDNYKLYYPSGKLKYHGSTVSDKL